ncbi:PhzF family phenazine biosynthesis protein ['Paenibacillus yunnanensis' Narsing Rao et al. 2020]|uniref:PhzF family phenazine biosynthesis protein n=1 Tax=Paenibacillus tengchongensis TaxID=2608684 RepID=UPI00124CEAC6|nr:PhzF family phenazine biosynthesis protein [Paenibacillus tengchongensis]
MNTPIYIVDAFADQAYAGNPAAVCLLQRPADEDFMARTAAEMNLSETAFVWPEEDGYRLRWFTPAVEVNLCGHATLASAHVLWESGRLDPQEEARFLTRSGLLRARQTPQGISLFFPPYGLAASPPIPGLAAALGIAEEQVLETVRYADNVLVRLGDEALLRGLRPDYIRLAALEPRAVGVTAKSGTPGIDFVSRFFAPGIGVNEDPVTGSLHTALAPYWAERLGRSELTAYQVSARGGLLYLQVSPEQVILSGNAVTVVSGLLQVDPELSYK